jgi:hypothetical protein
MPFAVLVEEFAIASRQVPFLHRERLSTEILRQLPLCLDVGIAETAQRMRRDAEWIGRGASPSDD